MPNHRRRSGKIRRRASAQGIVPRSTAAQYAVEPLEPRTLLSTSVTQFHNDAANTGWNPAETALTPANLNIAQFGQRFKTVLDDPIVGEPLYAAAVNITTGPLAGVHDTVFTQTTKGSFYAVDAHSGAILYKSILNNGGNAYTRSDNIQSAETCSAVLDLPANSIYVTGIYITSSLVYQRISRINIQTGAYTAMDFAASVPAGAPPNTRSISVIYAPGTSYALNPVNAIPRDMRIHGDELFIAWDASSSQRGWLTAFNKATLEVTRAFVSTPNGGGGGVFSPVFESENANALFVNVGFGTFDGQSDGSGLDANGLPGRADYGASVLKLQLDDSTTQSSQTNVDGWGFKVVDYFHSTLATVASTNQGGLIVLPGAAGTPAHPRLLAATNAVGALFLLDRDNLGKYAPAGDHAVDVLSAAVKYPYESPAYFDGAIYAGEDAAFHVRQTFVVDGALTNGSASNGIDDFNATATTSVSVSSNGLDNGILWVLDQRNISLRAYDAGDLESELWNSDQAGGYRDRIPADFLVTVKFLSTAPAVADGMVFVAGPRLSSNEPAGYLVGYGLFPAPLSAPAAPSNLLVAGVSSSAVHLTFIDNATNEQGDQVQVSTDGDVFFPLATVNYDSNGFSATGLSPDTYYWFRVRAFNSAGGLSESAWSNTVLAHTLATGPTLDFSLGFATGQASLHLVAPAVFLGTDLQLLPYGGQSHPAAWSLQKQPISSFETSFTFSWRSAAYDGLAFVVQNNATNTTGGSGSGLGYSGIGNSVAVAFKLLDANASPPSTGPLSNGVVGGLGLSYPVAFQANDVIRCSITYDGCTLTEILSDTFTGAILTRAYAMDIPALVGAEAAYVGFVGGSGGQKSDQRINTWEYTPIPPNAPPQVQHVEISSTAWTAPYLAQRRVNRLGDGLGHAIPFGPGQLTDLAFTNINQVVIHFTHDVVVAQGDLQLVGVNVPNYTFSGFFYDPATFDAIWTLSAPIANDKLLIVLSDHVHSHYGALDGEWTTGSDHLASGDGVLGGDFLFRFNVLPGDVTHDNAVFGADVLIVRNQQGGSGQIAYDVNGNNSVSGDDVILTRNAQFTFLPDGEPAAPLAALPAPDDIAALAIALGADRSTTAKLAAGGETSGVSPTPSAPAPAAMPPLAPAPEAPKIIAPAPIADAAIKMPFDPSTPAVPPVSPATAALPAESAHAVAPARTSPALASASRSVAFRTVPAIVRPAAPPALAPAFLPGPLAAAPAPIPLAPVALSPLFSADLCRLHSLFPLPFLDLFDLPSSKAR